MPVTIQKKKVKPAEKEAEKARLDSVEETTKELVALVDALAQSNDEVKELRSRLKVATEEYEAVNSRFQSLYDEVFEADDMRLIHGKMYRAKVGKKSKMRRYLEDANKTIRKKLEAVKKGLFDEIAQVKLMDLDKYLTPDQISEVVTVERGTRKISFEKVD